MTEKNDMDSKKEKSLISKIEDGLIKYQKTDEKSVISFFGIELTAPSNLKNPGIVYLSFIFINFIIFALFFKNFLTGS